VVREGDCEDENERFLHGNAIRAILIQFGGCILLPHVSTAVSIRLQPARPSGYTEYLQSVSNSSVRKTAGYSLNPRRNQLGEQTIEAGACVKSWIIKGVW
jgi:hypothetical protein